MCMSYLTSVISCLSFLSVLCSFGVTCVQWVPLCSNLATVKLERKKSIELDSPSPFHLASFSMALYAN